MPRLASLVVLSLTCMSQIGVCAAGDDRYRTFNEPHLEHGRSIWLGTCEGCHGWGIAGAPIPMNFEQWKPRLEKGRETLYLHALEGFFGPDDTLMPARGGNDQLTDDEIKAAVDYMIELAKSHKTKGDIQ